MLTHANRDAKSSFVPNNLLSYEALEPAVEQFDPFHDEDGDDAAATDGRPDENDADKRFYQWTFDSVLLLGRHINVSVWLHGGRVRQRRRAPIRPADMVHRLRPVATAGGRCDPSISREVPLTSGKSEVLATNGRRLFPFEIVEFLSTAALMLDVRCDTPRHDEPTDRRTRRETKQTETSPTDRSPPPVLTPNNQSTERVVAFLILVYSRLALSSCRVDSSLLSQGSIGQQNFRLLSEVVAPYPTKPPHSSAPRGAAHSSSACSRTRTTRIDRRKPPTYR
jgi:hypothetical protein